MGGRSKDRHPAIPRGIGLGEPIEREGVTLIPVFSRRGAVRGAYVIAGGKGRWEPAFNLTQAILVGNMSWWLMLLFAWWLIRRRHRADAASEAAAEAARPAAPEAAANEATAPRT